MSKSKKEITFTVSLQMDITTSVEVTAETMEEALQKAREIKVGHIIECEGYIDSCEVDVIGVMK